jgi:hypothetical protein
MNTIEEINWDPSFYKVEKYIYQLETFKGKPFLMLSGQLGFCFAAAVGVFPLLMELLTKQKFMCFRRNYSIFYLQKVPQISHQHKAFMVSRI